MKVKTRQPLCFVLFDGYFSASNFEYVIFSYIFRMRALCSAVGHHIGYILKVNRNRVVRIEEIDSNRYMDLKMQMPIDRFVIRFSYIERSHAIQYIFAKNQLHKLARWLHTIRKPISDSIIFIIATNIFGHLLRIVQCVNENPSMRYHRAQSNHQYILNGTQGRWSQISYETWILMTDISQNKSEICLAFSISTWSTTKRFFLFLFIRRSGRLNMF